MECTPSVCVWFWGEGDYLGDTMLSKRKGQGSVTTEGNEGNFQLVIS